MAPRSGVERVVVVSPRGFCAGVVRAIATVERALAIFGPPVYVRRAIVHNAHVVERLSAAGAVFVDEVEQVPRGAVVVLSAHGVAASVHAEASARELSVVDATCPLVAKVHNEVRRFRGNGYDVVLIGEAGHDEVIGTLGQAPGVRLIESAADVAAVRVADPARVACVTQTTLSAEAVAPVVARLHARFPQLVQPLADDICYATRNRQAAVAWLARHVDVVLIVGDRTSANSRRLCEAARMTGTPSFLVETVADLQDAWLERVTAVGVSAGASTPEDVVVEIVKELSGDGAAVQDEVFLDERVSFCLPRALASLEARADPRLIGHMLRIRIAETGKAEMNVAMPLSLARHGITFGAVTARRDLAKWGIDLERALEGVTSVGPITDVMNDHGRVEISIE